MSAAPGVQKGGRHVFIAGPPIRSRPRLSPLQASVLFSAPPRPGGEQLPFTQVSEGRRVGPRSFDITGGHGNSNKGRHASYPKPLLGRHDSLRRDTPPLEAAACSPATGLGLVSALLSAPHGRARLSHPSCRPLIASDPPHVHQQ
ncbi:hypothetical protein NDU88_001323, partial [Pleurodeles waltl]